VTASELAPGLVWWQARHPDWPGEEAGWGPEVSSYAVVGGDSAILLDPLSPPADLAAPATVVILTCAWHRRDAAVLAATGADVYAPQPLDGVAAARTYELGETLPGGVEAHAAFFPDECALWIPSHRALVFGEILYGVDGGARLPPPEWLPEGVTTADVKERLAPLADLEAEWFLPTHGTPTANAAAVLRSALRG
jgi:hypothetical protein